jgi:hypothetical protein
MVNPAEELSHRSQTPGTTRRAGAGSFALGSAGAMPTVQAMNHRTKAEYFIQGITRGFVEASEVIAWSDEVVARADQTEDWMIEISSCGPDDRMVILSHLNTIKGEVDAAELAALLKAKGVA